MNIMKQSIMLKRFISKSFFKKKKIDDRLILLDQVIKIDIE